MHRASQRFQVLQSKSRLSFGVALVVAATTVAVGLTGCAPERDVPKPVFPTTMPSSNSTSTPEPNRNPVMVPGGTAEQNKAYFDFVNETLLAQNPSPLGKDIINNLVAAGFDKTKMQVTPDKTAVFQIQADAIEFSVLFDETCIVGDISAQGYRSIIGPTIDTGVCLAGKTRPINW